MELALIGLCTAPVVGLMRNIYKYKFKERDCIPLEQLSTGDIIFISHNLGRLMHNTVNIEFSHIGMTYRDYDGTLYFMELTPPGDNRKSNGGPGIYPFMDRYSHYNGYFCVRQCNYNISNELLMSAYNRILQCNVGFDYSFTSHFLLSRIGFRRDIHKTNEQGFYEFCCSEFVYLLLCHMNLIQFDEDSFHDSFRFLSGESLDEIYGPIFDIDNDYRVTEPSPLLSDQTTIPYHEYEQQLYQEEEENSYY